MVLRQKFYKQDSVSLAKSLLGCFLIAESPEGISGGRIVETEAYLFDDPASQTYRGMTKRNFPLFGPPGFSYVYQTYGKVLCLNVTSSKRGKGEGVLIRALEPTHGIDRIRKRRGKENIKDLCSGPGKTTQALGISLADSNKDLRRGRLKIYSPESFISVPKSTFEIMGAPRVGISKAKDLLQRFYIKGSEFISRP